MARDEIVSAALTPRIFRVTPNLPRLADGFMMRAAYQPNTTELDEIGALRVAAWTPVFGAEAFGGATGSRFDEWDTRALHFTVHGTSSGSVCAAARLTVHHDLAANPPPDLRYGPRYFQALPAYPSATSLDW